MMVIMEAVTQYLDRKTELEEKIRSLEAEKDTLRAAISALKEKVATLELERAASALESEVQSLKNEKTALEEKVATYASAPHETQQ